MMKPTRLGSRGCVFLLGLALIACGCPATSPSADRGGPDFGPPTADVGVPDLGRPDLTPADLSPDSKPGRHSVKVTSDKVLVNPTGPPRVHLRVGSDHVIMCTGQFSRISSTGKVLARKDLPRSVSGSPYVNVISTVPSGSGLLALYNDHAHARVAPVSLDGTFSSNSHVFAKSTSNSDIADGVLVPNAGGVSVVYAMEDPTAGHEGQVRVQALDPTGKRKGAEHILARHPARWFVVDGGFLSYMAYENQGFQLAQLELASNSAKLVVSSKLVPNNGAPPCRGRWFSRAPSGETWVGLSTNTKKGVVLQYTVVKDGKPLLPQPQDIGRPVQGDNCFTAVANDGKRFVVLWAEERHAVSEPPRSVYRARVFDLAGQPLTPPHDVALESTIVWVMKGGDGSLGQMVWTGKDFVLFYTKQWLYGAHLRMARLELRE